MEIPARFVASDRQRKRDTSVHEVRSEDIIYGGKGEIVKVPKYKASLV